MKHLLVLDDDLDIQKLLDMFLTKKGFEISTAGSIRDAKAVLKKEQIDLVLSDQKLPDGDGLTFSKELLKERPDLPVIMITAYSDVRVAVKAVKRGIFDYITKPLLPDELLATVKRALNASPSRLEPPSKAAKSKKKDSTSKQIDYVIGNDPKAIEVYDQIALVAPTSMSVIISGETGSGKEYVAREIHAKSNRANAGFVAIDCGALPDELAGSILFGHIKGAFTGALTDKVGSFEHANGGTLFLDEIGNLAMQHQVKLLRVLQESEVKRIGSNKATPLDVRVVVATNEDLHEMIQNGQFRQDLYFRLNEFSIRIPPLRERGDDVLLYGEHFLEQANNALNKNVKRIGKKTAALFKQYAWHGNLREMKNVIKRAVLLTQGDVIKPSTLPQEIRTPSSFFLQKSLENDASDLKGAALGAEQKLIMDALAKSGNNKSRAAELLNIDRKTLYNKLKQMEIS